MQLDPEKLAATPVGLNEVGAALQDWNVNLPTGTLFGPHRPTTFNANGQFMNADGYRP